MIVWKIIEQYYYYSAETGDINESRELNFEGTIEELKVFLKENTSPKRPISYGGSDGHYRNRPTSIERYVWVSCEVSGEHKEYEWTGYSLVEDLDRDNPYY